MYIFILEENLYVISSSFESNYNQKKNVQCQKYTKRF